MEGIVHRLREIGVCDVQRIDLMVNGPDGVPDTDTSVPSRRLLVLL